MDGRGRGRLILYPNLLRCRRTDARKRKGKWHAVPHNSCDKPFVRADPNGVSTDARRGDLLGVAIALLRNYPRTGATPFISRVSGVRKGVLG